MATTFPTIPGAKSTRKGTKPTKETLDTPRSFDTEESFGNLETLKV